MSLSRSRARIRSGKGRIRQAGADYLAYALLDSIIDHYYPVLESIGARLTQSRTNWSTTLCCGRLAACTNTRETLTPNSPNGLALT